MEIILPGKCDICTKPDGSRDHNLQQCRVCNILVHELCYGMPPTSAKDPDFVCRACSAAGNEIEVNVPSRLGGLALRDMLAGEDGLASLREFLDAEDDKEDCGDERRKAKTKGARNMLAFHAVAGEFQMTNERDDSGGATESMKAWAQHIYDRHCANDAEERVRLPSGVLADIDAKIFDNNDNNNRSGEQSTSISSSLFDDARKDVFRSLERTRLLENYKKSPSHSRYLARHRTLVTQHERPSECVLCSVKHGTHAMHPLYDDHGPEGRQLLLPASGAGFRRKEARLAWVHTLCAMFISSSERTGGLVYGCDENGEYEPNDDDEEEGDGDEGNDGKNRVIDDSEDEDDESSEQRLREEQRKFTECERVFQPLMNQAEEASEREDASEILECIDSMIEHVEMLTPPFFKEYEIGMLVKSVKKSFEGTHPEVRARCKILTAKMKRVYAEKLEMVPDGFTPLMNAEDSGDNRSNAGEATDDESQRFKIGTSVAKEFKKGVYTGEIINYDAKEKLYRIKYSDGDWEDSTESEVSCLLLTYTDRFCMASGKDNEATQRIKDHQELSCVICKKKDNASRNCLRIPVQCSAGDPHEFAEFRSFHQSLNKRKTWAKKHGEHGTMSCTEAMHVGCARWGASDYAKVCNRDLRMCYYFSGKPPTYTGTDEYTVPVSNCFCRPHAREIQEGLKKESCSLAAGGNKRKRADATEGSIRDDVPSEHESDDDPAEKERIFSIKIAKKKNKKRILEESDEESD